MSSLLRIVRRMLMAEEKQEPDSKLVLYNPEDFAAAGGEMLVIVMILSWILTYFYNPDVIRVNPLKDRVGYNNLCVGWDTPPAKYVAAPLFCIIIFIEVRYMQLDYWRSKIDPTLDEKHRLATKWANFVNGLSWFGSIGIFSISPMEWPMGHTLSFVQLVVLGYVGYACNFFETPSKYHPRGSHVFLALFGIVCVGFGICTMIQMLMYDPLTKKRGPVPWQVMAFLDYSYFACMAFQGGMRPRAPSLTAGYKLVSDEDYKVPGDE